MKRSKMILLAVIVLFCGCGKTQTPDSAGSALMTFEIYDQAANFQGIQPGWFGELLKQKFNIQLNVIAPQVGGGSALFQTRAAAGSLGDIVILDNADFRDSVKAGLIKDIAGEIGNYQNLMSFKTQIDSFNATIQSAKNGQIYGIPCQMSNTAPTSFSEPRPWAGAWAPWDYFSGIGAPQLNNADDFLNALQAMQKKYPVNKAGEPAYAITLWADWDSASIENVNQPLRWYGAEPAGSLHVFTDGTMTPLTDDSGPYLKMLKFFFKANLMGIVDPDSGTQQWDSVYTKMSSKRVYLLWNNWQLGFTNNTANGNAGENFVFIPIGDMQVFQAGDSYYGTDRTWGVGSKVSGGKYTRVMEFLDWLASSEGLNYQYAGLLDFTYEKLSDGSYTRTTIGETRFTDNPPVPEKYGLGAGGFNDGNNWINQWIVYEGAIDPVTNHSYFYILWPDEIRKAANKTSKEWSAHYGGAENETDYLLKNNLMKIVPSVNIGLPSDTSDIELIRSQCGDLLCDTSWKMIFAKNEAEFNKLWSDMKIQLTGFGWDKLVEFDKSKYKLVADARAAAQK